ncbi:hypothetical protein GQ42DRAFT_7039 [Ramicandelaber brevisporus]|nr:hypothetical protein GQ42DRAFT_7039 [Ramicandelaber brevisporus]
MHQLHQSSDVAFMRWREITQVFPLLLPQSADGTIFRGFVEIHGEQLQCQVSIPDIDIASCVISGCERLERYLAMVKDDVQRRIAQAASLGSLLADVRELIERLPLLEDMAPTQATDNDTADRMLNDMERIGVERIQSFDLNAKRITVALTPEPVAGNVYRTPVCLQLVYSNESQIPTWLLELPIQPEIDLTNEENWIGRLVAACERQIRVCDRVLRDIDEVYGYATVIEPTTRSTAVSSVRIAVSPLVSVQIQLDPAKYPFGMGGKPPDCRFIGPITQIEQLRQKYEDTATSSTWNPHESLIANLERIFEMKLPSKQRSNTQSGDVDSNNNNSNNDAVSGLECGICYSFTLQSVENEEMVTPDTQCPNSKCSQPYHSECLVDWLRTDPSTRKSFSKLFGSCPFCSEQIVVTSTLV